ncbi:MAG: HD domain-containing protein [Acidobacteriota bacterium]
MPLVRDNAPIDTWRDGDFAQGFVLVERKDVRQDRNGRNYLDLVLSDASGRIIAKAWPDSPAMRSGADFAESDIVHIKGTVRAYREQLQLNLEHARRLSDADRDAGYDESLVIRTAVAGLDALWTRLAAIYPDALARPALRRLVAVALERHGDALRVHPAARSIHHAYRGGLLEHVVTMAELAQSTCAHYPDLDLDLVLVGVLFHDLGKLRELGAMPANQYTVEGHLIGHIAIGRDMLRDCCAAVDDLDEETRLHLEHLVLAHHGRREYGSPVAPATAEAFVLHVLDDLDSKLNQLREAGRGVGPAIRHVRGLDRYVYYGRTADGSGTDANAETGEDDDG